MPLFARGTFCECLRVACTKVLTMELINVSEILDFNKQKIEELHCLIWSPKNDLKKWQKNWNVAPDSYASWICVFRMTGVNLPIHNYKSQIIVLCENYSWRKDFLHS